MFISSHFSSSQEATDFRSNNFIEPRNIPPKRYKCVLDKRELAKDLGCKTLPKGSHFYYIASYLSEEEWCLVELTYKNYPLII
jgi:hypothetical protein